MKKIFFAITVSIAVLSCENIDRDFKELQYIFNQKVIDGYFVTSIAFDKQNNAWIGTFKQGLIKYNSSETIVYNSENSIISDTSVIYDIEIDSKNNIWIGCEGLIKFDEVNFTLYNSANTPIPEDFVGSIAIDSKDNIWFSSSRFRQGGVVKYDGCEWMVYTPDNSDLPANLVQSIAIDKNDDVWLALNEIVNNAYLVKISNDNWSIYTGSDLGFTPYYFGNIEVNSQNILYGAIDYSLSSLYYPRGPQVFIFDGLSCKQLQFNNVSNVKCMIVDNHDNIWCAFNGGYAVYDGQRWTLEESMLKDESVFSIGQSLDNKIWIGTGDGIYIYESTK